MEKDLERFDRWLRDHRPSYYARLLPGVTDAQLAALEGVLGFGVPESFKMLYRWRNGQPAECTDPFQYNQMFQSLERLQETCAVLEDLLEGGDFGLPRWWDRRWIPFTESYGGDHLCVDTAGSFGGRPGQLIMFSHDDADRPIEFPSLEGWLSAFVDTLEEGMWERDDTGFQPRDYKAWMDLCKARFRGYPIRARAGG